MYLSSWEMNYMTIFKVVAIPCQNGKTVNPCLQKLWRVYFMCIFKFNDLEILFLNQKIIGNALGTLYTQKTHP